MESFGTSWSIWQNGHPLKMIQQQRRRRLSVSTRTEKKSGVGRLRLRRRLVGALLRLEPLELCHEPMNERVVGILVVPARRFPRLVPLATVGSRGRLLGQGVSLKFLKVVIGVIHDTVDFHLSFASRVFAHVCCPHVLCVDT
eukprot:Polyplicarium_translucidae@DN1636_c0_g1_i1.p1